jgi:hypothetical protein
MRGLERKVQCQPVYMPGHTVMFKVKSHTPGTHRKAESCLSCWQGDLSVAASATPAYRTDLFSFIRHLVEFV